MSSPAAIEPDQAMLRDWLALSLVPGLGPRLTDALLRHFGSASAIRSATVADFRAVPLIGEKLSQQFFEGLRAVDVDAEWRRLLEHDVRVVLRTTSEYPAHLKTIDDAPHLLYVRGRFSAADVNAVAVIGSRTCTPYGRRMTQKLSRDLAQAGYTVVSGLARGIDGEAHEGALAGGGRTLAVLAGGLSRIYPPEHADLARRVVASGALISETPMGMEPQRGMFHARNRLISGLSQAVVVVEANAKSGTLITVTHAAEQNREVYAFPGNVDSKASEGTLELLRNSGAKLIRGIDDLLEDLQGMRITPRAAPEPAPTLFDPPPPTAPKVPQVQLEPAFQRVYDYLSEQHHLDQLVRDLEISISEAQRILMMLEMKRLIRRLPGNHFVRNN